MAFKDHPAHIQTIALLQRSLERNRLAHGYLFVGQSDDELEALARCLFKTLNCEQPLSAGGVAVDCCDVCLQCRKIDDGNHADVFWVRPESTSRQIRIHQITHRDESPHRVLLDAIYHTPTESRHKMAAIVSCDRLNENAANAFLKSLEEPPPGSVIVLMTTEPERVLETIQSRCLRLNFGGGGERRFAAEQMDWLAEFARLAAAERKNILARYRVLGSLVSKLGVIRSAIEEELTAKSPLEKYPDVEEETRKQWEKELKAAIEADYKRQRGEWLALLQWWLRDVWLLTLSSEPELLAFPELAASPTIARRLTPDQARENLRLIEETQRILHTNVQEALALEVGLLKLTL